jgi:hypothetical protein
VICHWRVEGCGIEQGEKTERREERRQKKEKTKKKSKSIASCI